MLFFTLLLVFCVLSQVVAEAPSSTKVSASIKDTTVSGLEGFNVNVAAPFKFQDYVLGFRYALGNLKRSPESLFARRKFETPAEGLATVDAEYVLDDKVLDVAAKWESDKYGVKVGAEGNTKDRIKKLKLEKSVTVNSNKLSLKGIYNAVKKTFSGTASLEADRTTVDLEYDSVDKSPILSVTRALDDFNEITPSIDLRSGDTSYAYKRKWEGGSLKGKLFPGEKVEVEWKDEGSHGTWSTAVDVPIKDTANTKVSVSHEWKY
eukprot:gene8043-8873_t